MATPVVEVNENGVPYYKWPPFPQPPPGAVITPFSEFKPSGIRVREDDDDVELDALGIPTVVLDVKHDNERKTTKKKAKKVQVGNNHIFRLNWWDEWSEGEEQRVFPGKYKLKTMNIEERFTQASQDFKSSRPWPTTNGVVNALYDQMRIYVGLIGNPTIALRKMKGGDDEDDEDELSDDEMVGQEPVDMVVDPPAEPEVPARGHGEDNALHPRPPPDPLEKREKRMKTFLKDPDVAIRIFLSSYFRDKGLFWSDAKLRDGPLIVWYFLRFLHRNKALPELQDSIARAIAVADIATVEMPQTKRIATALPDTFGKACTALWGSRRDIYSVPIPEFNPEPPVGVGSDNVPTTSEPTEQPPTAAQENSNVHNGADWGSSGGGWATQVDVSMDGTGWELPSASDPGGWGVDNNPSWMTPEPSLLSFLGPTTFPFTHTTGNVEKSTRKVLSWTIPPVDDEGNPTALTDNWKDRMAVLLVCPWHTYSKSITGVRPPKMLNEPEVDVQIPPHDPLKDTINVLITPKAAGSLRAGMGIGATWVQVVRTSSDLEDEVMTPEEPFWYAEIIEEILPSYWVDPE